MTPPPKGTKTPEKVRTKQNRGGKGRPKGSPKVPGSGRQPGSKNQVTKLREAALDEVSRKIMSLTDDEIDKMTALDVFKLGIKLHLQSGQLGLALFAAQALAPYKHAKLAPKIVDDEDEDGDGDGAKKTTIVIRGGFKVE
jgi:hypothetical protein